MGIMHRARALLTRADALLLDPTAFMVLIMSLIAGLVGLMGLLGLDEGVDPFLLFADFTVFFGGLSFFLWLLRHPASRLPRLVVVVLMTALCLAAITVINNPGSTVVLVTVPVLVCILVTGQLRSIVLYPLTALFASVYSPLTTDILAPAIIAFNLILFLTLWSFRLRADRLAKQRLEVVARLQHEQQLRNFMRSCQHELQNYTLAFQGIIPLVRSKYEVLCGDMPGDSLEPLLQAQEEIVARLKHLTNQLLLASKDGLLPLSQRKPFRLYPLVDGIRMAHEHAPQVQILVDVDPGLVCVGDREYIAMALSNAVRNALDALRSTPDGRATIAIRAAETPAGLCIRVEDSGPGYPRELLELLEHRPHQSEIDLLGWSSKPGGNGLGLSLMINVARLHGGMVDFGNRAGGRGGAWVEFQLPSSSLSASETDS